MAKKNLLSKYLAELGRKGGKARVKNLTPQQRQESARKAARARWSKVLVNKAPSKQHRDRNNDQS